MPSKGKKASKSASKLSNSSSEQSVTSSPWNHQSSSASTPVPNSEPGESDISSILEEASRKFPSFIAKNAFVGRIIEDAAAGSESRVCKIWLSESSMVAYSLFPGSIVSVSLASLGKKFSSNSPLRSFVDGYKRHWGSGSEHKMVDEVGNYFALAAVFPSSKILKNGVRLSLSLSRTLGYPVSGSIVFVYPLCGQSAANLVIGNGMLHSPADNCISIYNCKELYLELVSSNSDFEINSNKFSQFDSPAENGITLSPKTPLFSQSRPSSPSTSHVSSTTYQESVSNTSRLCGTSFDSFDIREVLGDKSAKNLLETCVTSWLCSRSLLCGNLVIVPLLSKQCIFQVVGANKMSPNRNILNVADESLFPQELDLVDRLDDAFTVDQKTKVYLYPPLKTVVESAQKRGLLCEELDSEEVRSCAKVNISKLGGLSKEYAILKDIIISSSVKGTMSRLGVRPIKGVLLHGPIGTGKTSLAQLCARDAGIKLFHVKGPEVVSQFYGESEQALHEVFDSATKAAPSVVFIDELDAIAPARKDGSEELSQRMVGTLLNLMDGISSAEGVLVIAATNRLDCIEPALRRPGRFGREIEIGVPYPSQRYDILLALLGEIEHSLSDLEVRNLAAATHGFVGADLAALCNEAALFSLRRNVDFLISSAGIEEGFDFVDDANNLFLPYNLDSACSSIPVLTFNGEALNGENDNVDGTFLVKEDISRVNFADFEKARSKIRPSAMREVALEVPKVSWEDVGGQKEIKMQLIEAVEWPQKHQDVFKMIGTRPPTGLLMFGPPGCSKTLLARAVASEAGLNFLAVKGPELFNKWVGESEKAVRSLFAKARANAPSIIFFDEIDALAIIRGKEGDGVSVGDRVMSELLVELDGLHQRTNVTVIAATNRPDKIDPALLRPGRFDRLIYVGPPNESDREDIFHIHLRKIPCGSDVSTKELALLTEGYTGADISLVCRLAAVAAMEESFDASEITMEHLKYAIQQVEPTEVESYQDLLTKFQRFVQSTNTEDDLGCQPSSGRSSWIPFWTRLKSIALSLYRFPEAILQSKSSSVS